MPHRRAGNQLHLPAAETQFRKQIPGVLAPIDRFLGQVHPVHSVRKSQPLQGGRLTPRRYYPDWRSPTCYGPRCGPAAAGHQDRITTNRRLYCEQWSPGIKKSQKLLHGELPPLLGGDLNPILGFCFPPCSMVSPLGISIRVETCGSGRKQNCGLLWSVYVQSFYVF